MKRLFLKLFLRPKMIGQVAAFVASLIAASLVGLIGGLPEFAQPILAAVFNLPEGATIDAATVTAVLTPIFLAILNVIIQEFVIKDNNKVLSDLATAGFYEGPLDGWVGPNAREAIDRAIDITGGIQNFR